MLESSDESQLSSLHAQILRDPAGKNVFAVTPVPEFLSLIALATRGLEAVVEKMKVKCTISSKIDLVNYIDHDVKVFLKNQESVYVIAKTYKYSNKEETRLRELYEALIDLTLQVETADNAASQEDHSEEIAAYDNAKRRDEESFPEQVVKSLIAGENPTKVFRRYRGMTQKALAEKARVRQAYISQIEQGMRIGSPRTLRRVAEALGVDIDDLV